MDLDPQELCNSIYLSIALLLCMSNIWELLQCISSVAIMLSFRLWEWLQCLHQCYTSPQIHCIQYCVFQFFNANALLPSCKLDNLQSERPAYNFMPKRVCMHAHTCSHHGFVVLSWSSGDVIPDNIASVTLADEPLDVVYERMDEFVKDFRLEDIRDPQQVWQWYGMQHMLIWNCDVVLQFVWPLIYCLHLWNAQIETYNVTTVLTS